MKISIIVAVAKNGVIGKNNALPWHLPADMIFFKEKTTGHCILTGKKNYFSIPAKNRPLKNRTNLILTRDIHFTEPDCHIFHDIESAIDFAEKSGETELMIIGGAEIFRLALEKNLVDRIYVTEIQAEIEGDVFFEIPKTGWDKKLLFKHFKDEKNPYNFEIYCLDLMR